MNSDRVDHEAEPVPVVGCADGVRHILLVGPADERSQSLSQSLSELTGGGTCRRVDGYLIALGEIASGSAPTVVIGRASSLNESLEATTRALRRIAPDSRLVFIADRDQQSLAKRAVACGFDDHLTEPVSAQDLRRAVLGPHHHRETRAAALAKLELSNVPKNDAPVSVGAEIGDVDLIERMLNGCSPIVDLALKMIRQQSGIANLGWVATEGEVPDGHRVVKIGYRQWTGGFLHVPRPSSSKGLEPWAAWLGRWLAVEQRTEELWNMAMKDELTGVWNRRYFERFLNAIVKRAAAERFHVTLMVFDIDDFKIYNDRYGHGAGDDILREAARLMVSVVREHDVVARIGGDEFAVIFWDSEGPRRPDSHHPHDVFHATRRYQRAICDHRFPKLAEAPATLSISGGLAGFPWDGRTPEELLEQADQMALQSKKQGKNAITFGPGTKKVCEIYFDENTGD